MLPELSWIIESEPEPKLFRRKITRALTQSALAKLNQIIRGWANYFRNTVAKEIFNTLDNWMFYKASRYATRKHPKKSKDWQHRKYWGQLNLDRDDHWVFGL